MVGDWVGGRDPCRNQKAKRSRPREGGEVLDLLDCQRRGTLGEEGRPTNTGPSELPTETPEAVSPAGPAGRGPASQRFNGELSGVRLDCGTVQRNTDQRILISNRWETQPARETGKRLHHPFIKGCGSTRPDVAATKNAKNFIIHPTDL